MAESEEIRLFKKLISLDEARQRIADSFLSKPIEKVFRLLLYFFASAVIIELSIPPDKRQATGTSATILLSILFCSKVRNSFFASEKLFFVVFCFLIS